MPFKSKEQERWAFANHMPWAKKWAKKTDQKDLPEKIDHNKIKKAMKKVMGR